MKKSTGSKCNFAIKSLSKYLDHQLSVIVLLGSNSAIIFKFEDSVNIIHGN